MQLTFHEKGICCRARGPRVGLAAVRSAIGSGGGTEAAAGCRAPVAQLMRLLPSRAPRTRARLIAELRRAIDCLPVETREAMLAGVSDQQRPVLVGAYTDGEGGACPMLAAHRRGGRTDFLAFACAWDRFAGVSRRPRRATRRELGILIAHLEASLLEDAAPDLERAIAEHRKSVEMRRWRERLAPRQAFEVLDPRGAIRARRLRSRYSASPGRVNMISGTTHAGEVFSR